MLSAKEYLEGKRLMCESMKECSKCPAYVEAGGGKSEYCYCHNREAHNQEQYIKAVTDWIWSH